jgi:hypothetical protein
MGLLAAQLGLQMDNFAFANVPLALNKGRIPLESKRTVGAGDLKQKISADPVYVKTMEAAGYGTIHPKTNGWIFFC